MSQYSLFSSIASWPVWDQFQLVPAHPPLSGSIFDLGEYLASLALFLVVLSTSDFRYKYRLALTKSDLPRTGFWVSLAIGVAILATDVWFENGLPVPKLISNANNLKAVFGFVFLAFVFRVISVAIVRPPVFGKRTAQVFFDVHYHLIHQGNPDRLQVIAEELRRSVATIIAFAAKVPRKSNGEADAPVPQHEAYAHDFLLLIGDTRFCKVVVDKAPAFAFACFHEAQAHMRSALQLFPFARNIGQEFIRNTSSSFYQEDSGYYSGLVGYTRPTTNVIFGNYEFIEKCAADGASPIDTDYREFDEFSGQQMRGFARASLAFLESCLSVTKGRAYPHSYALARMLDSFETPLRQVYKVDGVVNFANMREYECFEAAVDFIHKAIALVDTHAERPRTLRPAKPANADIYDDLAGLIFEAILAAAAVSSPPWTSWAVQYNGLWSHIFGFDDTKSIRIIALKVRRLLYDEIKRMDKFANFKGARILGYCLHVLGLKLVNRHTGFGREFYPIQATALEWITANFKRLLADHPKVAKACLQGSISYDADNHRLVKTYANEIGKEPAREFLELN